MSLSIELRPVYLTVCECARQFADNLLENNNLDESMSQLISPIDFSLLKKIYQSYFVDKRSILLSIIAEISSLCTEQQYQQVHFLISCIDEFLNLHNENDKYRQIVENYLDHIVYADFTDYFLSYPIQLQIQIMDIIENRTILNFPLMKTNCESDQSKIELFLQDTTRYFYNVRSRHFYRQLMFRLNDKLSSQHSILHALIIGCLFLPVTCHSAFLNELYSLLSIEPRILSLTTIETFYHVLCPIRINQFYSVPRAYLSLLLFTRLINVDTFFLQIIQISFLIYLRVPQIRVHLIHIIEPLCEIEGFQYFLDRQQRDFELSQQHSSDEISLLQPLFIRIQQRLTQGFTLKQLCRIKIRSILSKNHHQDILSQLKQIEQLSERNQNYLTYQLKLLLDNPERFYESTRSPTESVWNSTIPPPPDIHIESQQ